MILQKGRPKSSFSKSMQVNLFKESIPFPQRKRTQKKLSSLYFQKVDSIDPETIYTWLDDFDKGLGKQGKSY